MNGWMDGVMNVLMDGWLGKKVMDEWMDGWLDEEVMDVWMDGRWMEK